MVIFCLALVLGLTVKTNARESLDAVMPVRGFCIAAPRPADCDKFIAFIDHDLAPRKVNTLVLRVDYNYRYKTRPELAGNVALSKSEVKKLVAVCRKDGIKIIPQINLLGHQSDGSWLGNLLRKHPEFDETPWVKMPKDYQWPNADKLYCKSYCPLHPRVHEAVFAAMDELCDVFEADTFHAGMDEVFYLGEDQCPRCHGLDKAELFAGEVRRIHDHLQQHGRNLWIWGDRLIDGRTTGVGEWEGSFNNTDRAIDLIPKDITLCDWHYESRVPTAAYFAIKGFHVVTCPWKSAETAIQQAGDMARWRATATPEMKPRFCGMMQTVWSGTGTFLGKDKAGKGNPTNSWNCFVALFDNIRQLEQPHAMPIKP